MWVASPQESRARRRGAIAHRGGTSGGDRRVRRGRGSGGGTGAGRPGYRIYKHEKLFLETGEDERDGEGGRGGGSRFYRFCAQGNIRGEGIYPYVPFLSFLASPNPQFVCGRESMCSVIFIYLLVALCGKSSVACKMCVFLRDKCSLIVSLVFFFCLGDLE